MNNVRILHCGKLIDNYYLCVNEKVAGFSQKFRIGGTGDLIYLSIKIGKESLCGARGVLGEITDIKPWEDSEKYIQCFKIKDIEFCEPFDMSVLREAGGQAWGAKYLQGSKLIKDRDAINILDKNFVTNKRDTLYIFNDLSENTSSEESQIKFQLKFKESECEEYDKSDEEEEILDILGTFQTIRFRNETDPIRGLEPLVTKYFYNLFQFFTEDKSILISNNRLFSTVGLKNDKNENIPGIKGIPDAVLITYDRDSTNTPLRINLIEYECYGEGKYRNTQKLNYLNGTILPQLIRFASTFSIVTDYKIREKTINEWIEKIISYIDSNQFLMDKVDEWMKDLNPKIRDREINSTLKSELKKAFESNIKIILIIDELTIEQKETIKNVINSFKLNNTSIKERENCVGFSSYVVRLEQKVGAFNEKANFALSFQE
ncbi:hypothetical protein [Turicibacter sp. TJ11]|uniref:hypothetical protein n=1 Tax=Turicibacter sp. TJ11 TaxID=2806443 RepID=UPI001F1AFAF3|nr:hypothetical protein [Turicibacter sp. TJ11]